MDLVTLAALICAILSGIDFLPPLIKGTFSPLACGVFILSLALTLSGLGVI